MSRKVETAEKRFWVKVNKLGPDDCWEWLRGKTKNGYGRFRFGNKTIRAHRFSWFLKNGKVPKGLLVLHYCDNPGCVNPKHLWLGTYDDNNKDRKLKKRSAFGKRNGKYTHPEKKLFGEQHPNSKLSREDVKKIKRRIKFESLNKLASEFKVSKKTIFNIKHNLIWKEVLNAN